jgi:methylated-DNA-[protein]-cysteine S-methyltransferase
MSAMDTNFAIFETAIGAVGIAWNPRGLIGVQLPHSDEAKTRRRMRQRFPDAQEAPPSPEAQAAIDGITALLRGEPRDLTGIKIDDSETPAFNAKVYAITRKVPPGKTITYGEIATQLGDKLLAGGFSAIGGVVTKLKLLSIEGAAPGGPTLFDRLPLETRPNSRG